MTEPESGGGTGPLAWLALACLGLIALGGVLVSYGKIDVGKLLGPPKRKTADEGKQPARGARAESLEGVLEIRTEPPGAHVFVQLSGHRSNTPRFEYLGRTPYRKKRPIDVYDVVLFHSGTLVRRKLRVTAGGEQSTLELRMPVDRHPEMVLVPAGWFQMGSEKGSRDEKPQRRVWLDAYYIDRHEVSNLRYQLFLTYVNAMGGGGHKFCHPEEGEDKQHEPTKLRSIRSEEGRMPFNLASQPVAAVDWYDAYAYARWAGKSLPSEAEWEKAAGWSDDRKIKYAYPWGAEDDLAKAHVEQPRGTTAKVDAYPQGKSPVGAYQMIGNVYEWVADWYDPNAYSKGAVRNPRGPEKALPRRDWKVLRGGSGNYFHFLTDMRRTTYARYKVVPGLRDPNIGFRCVIRVKPKAEKK